MGSNVVRRHSPFNRLRCPRRSQVPFVWRKVRAWWRGRAIESTTVLDAVGSGGSILQSRVCDLSNVAQARTLLSYSHCHPRQLNRCCCYYCFFFISLLLFYILCCLLYTIPNSNLRVKHNSAHPVTRPSPENKSCDFFFFFSLPCLFSLPWITREFEGL